MRDLEDFARQAASNLVGDEPIFVVSNAYDADPLAAPFLVALRSMNRNVGYACLWTEITELTPELTFAPFAQEYVENEPRNGRFVILLSTYRSVAEVMTFIGRFTELHSMDRILVVCATKAESVRDDLSRDLPKDLVDRIELVEGELESVTVPVSDSYDFPDVIRVRRNARRAGT